jgi:nucleoside-diphosphate-sugar epimerase
VGYIDQRDAAAACRLALDGPGEGSHSFIIAAADTVMNRASAELMHEVFPGVPLTGETGETGGTGTLLSIARARRVLGFEPGHSWRDHLSP